MKPVCVDLMRDPISLAENRILHRASLKLRWYIRRAGVRAEDIIDWQVQVLSMRQAEERGL